MWAAFTSKQLCSGLRGQLSALCGVSANAIGARNYAAPRKTGLIEFLDLDPPDTPSGRSWQMSELKLKSFEDLQKLWYVCYKEQNMLLSEQARQKFEGKRVPKWDRMKSIKQTMARIKHVLSDRAKEKINRAHALRQSCKDGSDSAHWKELLQAGNDELARLNAK